MQPLVILKLLVLLTLANGAPVVGKKVLRRRFAAPLDGGLAFRDGRPLFGASKTARGLVLSVLATTAAAPILGIDWTVGAVLGAVAMAGDLFSSFVKRRLGLASGSRATVLDQVPESLFPLLACQEALSLTAVDILVTVLAFFVGEVLLSRLLYRIRLRDHPY